MFRIFKKYYISSSPIRNCNNKSFGQTNISEFYDALLNVRKGVINTDAEIWIHENDFCKGISYMLLDVLGKEQFQNFIADYNKEAKEFFQKNDKFYLTIIEE